MIAARLGTLAALGALYLLIFEYVLNAQWMLRSITIWLHLHSFHILPSAAWLAVAVWLGSVGMICAYFAGLWQRLDARPAPIPFGDAMRAQMFANVSVRSSLIGELLHEIVTPKSGASLPHLPEGLPKMFDLQSFLLKAEIAALQIALNAASNDRATFLSVMQAFVKKGGDEIQAIAFPLIRNQFASNPLLSAVLSAFEPQVESAISSELAKLESEAAAEEDKLLTLGVGLIQSEIASREAQLAAQQPSGTLVRPTEAPLLAAVEYEPATLPPAA